ncbi:MAG: hypothetical protein JJU11_13570 [Candidatus Sumerlaeia bacterium]|nr:hypothetical protein [Candidatus Sumerlaeia bacterium]
MEESREKSRLLVHALLLTGVALLFLALLEEYNPGGTPWAPLFLIPILIGHLALFTGKAPKFSQSLCRMADKCSARILMVPVIVLLLAGSLSLTWRQHDQIFSVPIDPLQSAHMGVLVQATSRWVAGETPLYRLEYPRAEGTSINRFPVGLKVPFLTARAWGLEWRFASMAGVILFAGLIVVAAGRIGFGGGPLAAPALAAIIAGSAWLLTNPVMGMLQWGYWAPYWPLIVALGLSLSAGWWVVVALLVGALAAMTPGWLLLLPLVAIMAWRENRKAFPALLMIMILLPLLSYGVSRAEGEDFLRGVIGSFFAEGTAQAGSGAWRFPTLQMVGDMLGMRHGFYLFALVLLMALGREIYHAADRLRRCELLVAASFVVIAFGPATYQFHWYAHVGLIMGLLPLAVVGASHPGAEPSSSRPWRIPLLVGGGVAAAGALLAIILTFRVVGAINRLPDGRQHHTAHLVSGFNIPSEDHVWGRTPHMVIGFTLDRNTGGTLEIELESLLGEFTPYNPAVIRVNGVQKGVFLAPPGRKKVARLDLHPEDVHIGFNIVEIKARWARSPQSYNIHDDHRPLSLRYTGMTFTPMTFQR